MNILVFSDLDGTLLDHGDYSFEAAKPALKKIREHQIPLILTSSKTRHEIELLQRAMGIHDPFIAENGAAIFFPYGYRNYKIDAGTHHGHYTVIQLGTGYGMIRCFFAELKKRFDIKGFGDMSLEEVVSATGLKPEEAELAMRREFTEPFLINDISCLVDLQAAAESRGFTLTQGGRFFHLMGKGHDKGKAARTIADIFSSNSEGALITIGLGDSANDISMLSSVDIPIVIPASDSQIADIRLPKLRRAVHPGSKGWNEMIMDVLSTIDAA